MDLSEDFWDSKYKSKDVGWDLGVIAPPLKSYFDQLTNTDLRILIPGAGHAYEAEYLHDLGFKQVFVADISKTALQNIKSRVPSFPSAHLIHKNFFELDTTFDLIIEHTFFCALQPKLRPDYVDKVTELLRPKGKVVGLLFNVPLNDTHPPFGGSKAEYITHFEAAFDILIMDKATNSIASREDTELFFSLEKKHPVTS